MRPLLVLAALVAVACAASIDTEERLLEKLQQILAQGDDTETKQQESRWIPASWTISVTSSSISFRLIKDVRDPATALYQVKYRAEGQNWTPIGPDFPYNSLDKGMVTISGLNPDTKYDLASYFRRSANDPWQQRGNTHTTRTSASARERKEVTFYDN